MSTPKPTFVFVPGAWHPPFVYSAFLTYLHKAGFPAIIASLPSLDAKEPSTADCQKDAASVRQQISPLIEDEGQSLIILCQSYGGIPGGCFAHGLSKSLRSKQGKQGGVIGLIYMSAFVVPEGKSLLEYLGGTHAPYPSQGLSTVADPKVNFFADVDPRVADVLTSSLLPHALKAFDSPASAPAWAETKFAGKLAFLRCMQDEALPVFVQNMFTEKSGVEWMVTDIQASHSPWASKPEETVEILGRWAEEFASQA